MLPDTSKAHRYSIHIRHQTRYSHSKITIGNIIASSVRKHSSYGIGYEMFTRISEEMTIFLCIEHHHTAPFLTPRTMTMMVHSPLTYDHCLQLTAFATSDKSIYSLWRTIISIFAMCHKRMVIGMLPTTLVIHRLRLIPSPPNAKDAG